MTTRQNLLILILTIAPLSNVFAQIVPINFSETGPAILVCPNGKGFLDITHNQKSGKYFALYANANGMATKVLLASKAIESDGYFFGNTSLTIPALQSPHLDDSQVIALVKVGNKKQKTIACKKVSQ